MSEELMITQQDLINWIDRPPSNDDLDLATFISTRLENFYELEKQLQQKENIIKEVKEYMENYIEVEDAPINERIKIEFKELLKMLDKVEE